MNLHLLALLTALMDPLGMPIATGLYVAGAVWYLDRKRILSHAPEIALDDADE